MLAPLAQWLLIVAIGQAPPEAALLKAAPADVDVAVRFRGIEAIHADLLTMLKAMDPDWANMAEGALAGPMADIRAHHGARAVTSPIVALFRIGEAGGDGPPPFAVLLPSDDYKGSLKEFMGGNDVALTPQDGGFDAFDGPAGQGTWYATKAAGLIAFGSSKGLIADIAKHPARTLDAAMSPQAARAFFAGDLGAYINAASLTGRYAERIDQARQALMGALDQAGQQAGNASAMQMARDIYGGLFDSLKYADALTLGCDVAGKGLHLAGFLKVKPGGDAAKAIADVRTGEIAGLGKLPSRALAYVYMNVGARTFDRLQGMSLKMVAGAGKPSPELEKAMGELHGIGRVESFGATSMEKGMRSVNDIRTEDPRAFIEKSLAILRAMRGGDGEHGLYKEVKIEPDARSHRGFTFTHAAVAIDMDRLAEMGGNAPAQRASMKALIGDGRMDNWYGTDGKRILHVVAPTWEEARSRIDTYLAGDDNIGRTQGFRAMMADLPARASFVILYSTQGLVRTMATAFAAIAQNPDLKAPADMPGDEAYLGASLTPHAAEGYEFHLVVPGAVGPVISKGLIPIVQGLGGAVGNP